MPSFDVYFKYIKHETGLYVSDHRSLEVWQKLLNAESVYRQGKGYNMKIHFSCLIIYFLVVSLHLAQRRTKLKNNNES
jgi:hypothetical protein